MKFKAVIVMTLFASQAIFAGANLDWGYSGQQAPTHWAEINPKYAACSGLNQSPINIDQTVDAKLPPLKFNYSTSSKSIINNARTVQINFNEGNFLSLDHKQFELKQFHLHSPSENLLHGQSYPMEMHLVHASKDGELTVVAVMFKEGQENKKLKQLWQQLPKTAGDVTALKQTDLASAFLPKTLDYYRFNGSLTTPPCSEGVRWIVLKEIQQASPEQIKAFSSLMEHPNNRPVQAQNARLVLE
ncbi:MULTISPECIES: carbonic anhydrase family protein [unclassified Acinetobacter]|uniref:carbonic anhydrase n=1 Tax=unclassified Acinetobacter TaxID=196816 RepID=UPI0029344D4B|nr:MULTISPECIES: carbonic anhydrase family protein [unclassified Acinetobacter]WOE32808.1 carbonic anhydrase family protein [Acinetobacter sp. SAAs470]WOE38285.1 carbonic anhydrase family protein [Acinetobacter sp. SAAs474]